MKTVPAAPRPYRVRSSGSTTGLRRLNGGPGPHTLPRPQFRQHHGFAEVAREIHFDVKQVARPSDTEIVRLDPPRGEIPKI